MSHVEIDARVAGAFRFVERRGATLVEHAGEYVALVPPRRLAFTLRSSDYAEASTLVTVDFAPQRAGCKLALLHERVPPDRVRELKARWIGILYGLGVTLDTMQPLTTLAAPKEHRAVTGEAQCITC